MKELSSDAHLNPNFKKRKALICFWSKVAPVACGAGAERAVTRSNDLSWFPTVAVRDETCQK